MTARKRRRPGEGCVYKRSNGTYAAVLDLGHDATGKRRRKFVYGPTETDVLAKLKELQRQLNLAGDLPTTDWTVTAWLTYWLKEIAVHRVKPGTYQSYVSAVNNYLIPPLGKRRLSILSPVHIRQMHAHVRAQGCNSTTAHNAHRILSAALNDAVREGKASRNVAALVRAPAKAASKRGALTFDEAKKVLSHAAKDERTAARWLAAFLLGARQGELLGLRWEYVNLTTGMVDLAWSLQPIRCAHGCGDTCGKIPRVCPQRLLPIPDGFEYEQISGHLCLLRPKTRASRRVVPLPDALWSALRLRQAQAADEPNPHGFVWTRPDGRPLRPGGDWENWKALLAAAGIKRNVTLHEARHSTATWLADANVPENVIVDLLGHSDVIVNRSYQHLSPTTGRAALNLLGEQLAPPAAALTV